MQDQITKKLDRELTNSRTLTPPARLGRGLYAGALSLAVFLLAGDRLLKMLAMRQPETESLALIKGVKFTYLLNYGLSFSLPWRGGIILGLLIAISLLFLYLAVIFYKKQRLKSLLLAIIAFSAINNIVDRLLYGGVIDYLDILNLTVINLSDALISLATLLLIISLYRDKEFTT